MADPPRYTVRLPHALDARVQARLRTTGMPFALLVREALAAYLADTPPPGASTATADMVRQLQKQLAALTTRVEGIEGTLAWLRHLAATPAPPSTAPAGLPARQQGRKDAVSREILEALAALRRQYPQAPLRVLAEYLYERGMYRSRTKAGQEGVASTSLSDT